MVALQTPTLAVDEEALRALVPRVLAGLVRRGEAFDAAEDALQEALLEALRTWPERPPLDARAWLTTVSTRRLVDARRSAAARRRREESSSAEPPGGRTEEGDDTLFLLFCCCHPNLSPASQVALTLRAVGGLTTREIADAYYVPEATMAQRISRAKATLRGRRLDEPGDLAVVLRVLYLIYTVGHGGRPSLTGEAIRLARQLTLATDEPEARGLLALMLLNAARLPGRFDAEGRLVTLDRQDRTRWDRRQIAEGVRVLQSALALERPGRYQIQAAIAALHDDAECAEETDWGQILAWYDDLVALSADPVRQDPAAVLGRAVALGHVRGAAAGLAETDRLREVLGDRHRWHAVRGHLFERAGDMAAAGATYAETAHRATDVAERDHLIRQAARVRASLPAMRAVEIGVDSAVGESDTVAVWRVYASVFGDYETVDAWRSAAWERHTAREGFRLARAVQDGGLVGFAYGYTGRRGQWWTDNAALVLPPQVAEQWLDGHFEVVSIGVLESVRGAGVGRRLLQALVDGLPHDRRLLMTTADESDPARRLYDSEGWQVLGSGIGAGTVIMGTRPAPSSPPA